MLVKSDQIQLVDICPFDLKMQGEDKHETVVASKGEAIPLRKRFGLKFPSG